MPAEAQTPPTGNAAPEAAKAPAPADPFGRTTPAGTINGFIDAIAAQDYERASQFLDLSGIPSGRRATAGPELAEELQRALDREGIILPATELSDNPVGNVTDGLEPDLESVGSLGAGEDVTPILLKRVEDDGNPHWLISEETLEAASEVSTDDGEAMSEAWLPAAFTDAVFAGAPVSHWLTLLAVTLVAFALIWLGLGLFLFILRRVGWEGSGLYRFLKASHVPLAVVVALIIVSSIAPAVDVSIVARQTYGWLSQLIAPLALGWLVLQLIDALSDRVLEGFGYRSRATATSIVRFAGRVAKVVIIAVTIMAILDALGFDVTGVIAALGIGGLALALGAQRTVENLIASVSIISDRPFRVGDFCKIGDTLGTVEDIGMRSTRFRTLGRTIVTIPNSNLVSSAIENYAGRDQFWFNPMLHLSTATPPAKLRSLLEAWRAILDGDSRLADRTARVRLLIPTTDRLPVEIFGYILAADYDEFLEVQEDLTLKLLDAVAEHDLVLAPPSLELQRRAGLPVEAANMGQ